ncbi:inner membrane magnesium transporter MRS2 [Magnaporthiopsis poae ATCC 64411]|uniref:Magnesium transporter n=1 Tax=Magnaporthiopsis poae (strain ATCC 64411 / 73-15) TaxID=644358 RepID=A0A0C4DW33_MAGP6|nr:inner membrane magnesium transporter MRS2 [Magnaporthiopsis poae ATCC 64411]
MEDFWLGLRLRRSDFQTLQTVAATRFRRRPSWLGFTENTLRHPRCAIPGGGAGSLPCLHWQPVLSSPATLLEALLMPPLAALTRHGLPANHLLPCLGRLRYCTARPQPRHPLFICAPAPARNLAIEKPRTRRHTSHTEEEGSLPPGDPRIQYAEVDEHGAITPVVTSTRAELLSKYGLAPRDIRKIDTSTLSHILIRPTTVLLHLFDLKVLVQRNRVLLFHNGKSSSPEALSSPCADLLRDLQDRIRQRQHEGQEDDEYYRVLPYEFRALEAVLAAVVAQLECELDAIREPAVRILRSLEEDDTSAVDDGLVMDRRKLRTLLGLSDRVTHFARQAELVRSAVEDVLDYDDRLAALYLTDRAAGRVRRAGHDDLTAIELLLDSYYKAYDEIAHEAQNLVSSIRNTEESISAILDANRNLLMVLDLKFRMGTLGLATGSILTGFYAMNIFSHIREFDWAFPGVSATSAVLAVAVGCYGLLVLRKFVRLRLEGRGEAMGQALQLRK